MASESTRERAIKREMKIKRDMAERDREREIRDGQKGLRRKDVDGDQAQVSFRAAAARREREAADRAAKVDAASRSGSGYGLDADVTSDMYKVAPELLGESARSGVTADQGSIDAQNRAMNELFGIYSNGGATAQERARMARTRADQDQYLRSQRDAQQQDLSERGMLGSGAEIAMALGDRQNAGTRMAQQDLDTEAMLQDRALGALMQGSNIAGQVRGSSFNEGMARGTAKDEFAAMNNNLINSAKTSNTDFLRQSKANLAQQQYDSWQRGLDRNVGVATGIMGFDQQENENGWSSGRETARNDAASATNAQNNANQAALNGIDPSANYAVNTGNSTALAAANEMDAKSAVDAAKGGGKVGGGIANLVGGGVSGDAAAGALNFGGSSDDDDDEEDK